MRAFLCGLILLLLTNGASSLDKPPVQFTIGGLRVGDALTEEFEKTHPPKRQYGKDTIVCTDSIKFDNGKSVFVGYFFRNRTLIGVSMRFESELYDKLVRHYADKFESEPHITTPSTIKTGIGASFKNERVIWRTDAGPFELSKYDGDLLHGSANLMSQEMQDMLKDREQAEGRELREKL